MPQAYNFSNGALGLGPDGLTFGPDGFLYVAVRGFNDNPVSAPCTMVWPGPTASGAHAASKCPRRSRARTSSGLRHEDGADQFPQPCCAILASCFSRWPHVLADHTSRQVALLLQLRE